MAAWLWFEHHAVQQQLKEQDFEEFVWFESSRLILTLLSKFLHEDGYKIYIFAVLFFLEIPLSCVKESNAGNFDKISGLSTIQWKNTAKIWWRTKQQPFDVRSPQWKHGKFKGNEGRQMQLQTKWAWNIELDQTIQCSHLRTGNHKRL